MKEILIEPVRIKLRPYILQPHFDEEGHFIHLSPFHNDTSIQVMLNQDLFMSKTLFLNIHNIMKGSVGHHLTRDFVLKLENAMQKVIDKNPDEYAGIPLWKECVKVERAEFFEMY